MIASKTLNASILPESHDGAVPAAEITVGTVPPGGYLQRWLSRDVDRMLGRLDQIDLLDRTLRDHSALRAGAFWDDDRRTLALDLAAKLAANPARVVAKLRATPQGCDTLAEQWGWLKAILDGGKTWDETQTNRAFDLLGIAAEHREAATGRLADPARLVRDELAALVTQRARVVESDAMERSMARADLIAPSTPEYRQLKRYEAATYRRLTWALALLGQAPADVTEKPAAALANKAAEVARPPAPTRMVKAPTPLPPTWIVATPPMIPVSVVPTPAPTRRPDPAKLRARAKDAARKRREDRPDR